VASGAANGEPGAHTIPRRRPVGKGQNTSRCTAFGNHNAPYGNVYSFGRREAAYIDRIAKRKAFAINERPALSIRTNLYDFGIAAGLCAPRAGIPALPRQSRSFAHLSHRRTIRLFAHLQPPFLRASPSRPPRAPRFGAVVRQGPRRRMLAAAARLTGNAMKFRKSNYPMK